MKMPKIDLSKVKDYAVKIVKSPVYAVGYVAGKAVSTIKSGYSAGTSDVPF